MLSNFFSRLRNKTVTAVAPFEQPQIFSLHSNVILENPRIASNIFKEIQRPVRGSSPKVLFDNLVISQNFGLVRPQIIEQPLLAEFVIDDLSLLESSSLANTPYIRAELEGLANLRINIIDIPFDYQDTQIICVDFGTLSTPPFHDLTEEYRKFNSVKIVDIPLLNKTRIDGKTYHTDEHKQRAERQLAQRRPSTGSTRHRAAKLPFNIFDLVFPILHLPLGEGLNNVFAFPEGKRLYSFQVEGIHFLINREAALLGDEMGLGKSIQIITAIRSLYRQGKITSVCIICPKAVLSDWEGKFKEWSPELRIVKVSGNKFDREIQWKTPAHVHICTYESLRNDWDNVNKLRQQRKAYSTSANHFDLITLDEIQKTKNPSAKLTKTVRDLQTAYRWGLSGTPVENGIQDLITICETLKQGILTKEKIYNEGFGYDMEKIKKLYQPIFLRRRVKDVMKDMPEKITHEVWLDLPKKQREAYISAEIRDIDDLKKMGEKITLQHVLAVISKLKQICNYYDGESVKLEHLQDKLEDLTEDGNKALVFSQYPNETLKKIQPELQKFNPVIYDGTLSDIKRKKIVRDFQETEQSKVMLISLKAGNAGITLTRANYVYHFDMWWNPAVSNQAVGRALRIGQKKTVFERFLLTKDTIEERIYQKVKQKQALFNDIVDDLSDESASVKNFTEDEIFGLLGLPKKKR